MEPLQAPKFESRNSNDPLSPDIFRNLTLSATQAIRAYDILFEIARHPETEPDFPRVKRALEIEFSKAKIYLKVLIQTKSFRVRLRELAEKLDMTKTENIKILSEAFQNELTVDSLIADANYLFLSLQQRVKPS